MSARAHQKKAILKQRRALLGITNGRVADPRSIARLAAQERAEDVAAALLAPLDEADLGALARQRAAVTILDATSPISTVAVEVQLPADEAGVQAMGWEQLQQLAAALLDEGEYQPVPALPQPQ